MARVVFVSASALLLLCACQAPSGASATSSEGADATTASFLPDHTSPPEAPRPALSTPDRPEDFAKWERDPARAKRKSELLDRPLLILFTGLSWSSNAKLLGEEVFLSKSFNGLARENLTLLYLDFPQNPRDAHPALQQFKEYYDVRGFPTVLILNPDGSVGYRRTGYVPGKAQDYFRELETAIRKLPKAE
jgi:hypothetical protein